MNKFGWLFVVGFCCVVSAWAGTPTLTAAEVSALVFPDVRVLSAVHHDGATSPNGVRVPHLDVDGVIGGSIHFELLLPDDWNGRFAMGGGGGLVGSVQNSARGSVNAGYATVGTDTGHQAAGTDGSWALDNMEALVNFGHVAIHRTAEVAKAFIHAYYGTLPEKSYFLGCSRGGGQAMMEAQRYPNDFDGIVAGAPAFDWAAFAAYGIHIAQTLYPNPDNLKETFISQADLDALYAAIMEQTDAQDGLEDGIIDDPTAVEFDLKQVDALSRKQRRAVAEIYDGVSNKDGLIYPGFPIGAEGGQGGWFQWVVGPMGSSFPNLSFAFTTNIYKYFVFNDAEWDYSKYKFTNWADDTHLAATILSAKDPNIDAFKSRGGKLIIWHGWSDAALPAGRTVSYYEDLLAHDPQAMDYARLFMVPGCYHCGGGPGISEVDWLSVISDWVENGNAPDRIVASKDSAGDVPAMTRPLYPYPQRAQYDGDGDPNDASNFVVLEN